VSNVGVIWTLVFTGRACSRTPVYTTREHGPSTRHVNMVVCTEHPCPFAVSAENIARQCFLATRPVKTGVILDTREHGPC